MNIKIDIRSALNNVKSILSISNCGGFILTSSNPIFGIDSSNAVE